MLRFLFVIIISVGLFFCLDVPIKVSLIKPVSVVDARFLSVSIDSSAVKGKFKDMNLSSKKLITLANGLTPKEMTPEIYLRLGGGNADDIIFDPTIFILNVTELDRLCNFVDTVGWKLIFDLNVLQRNHDGTWNPTNALELINYLKEKDFAIHYELGNEPDLFPRHRNFTIPPKQLAEDFKTLHNILKEKTGGKSMLIGPDIATLTRYNYFEEVLSNISESVLSAVSFHHYYSSSDHVSVSNFTDVKYLDEFLNYGLQALHIIRKSFSAFPHPPVWLGETSSTYGGGSAAVGESFAAGFLWLDKLGLAAQMNVSVVIRQALKGAYYSLLNENYDPNPDYWSSKLYKQLMGTVVLDVTGYLEYNRGIRIYAHCVNKSPRNSYASTSIVLMVLNLMSTESAQIRFIMDGWENLSAHLYLIQPLNGRLDDRHVTLNGNELKMMNNGTLPELRPVVVAQPYVLPPLSYGFLVILDSHANACKSN